jgi:hypothetical protein
MLFVLLLAGCSAPAKHDVSSTTTNSSETADQSSTNPDELVKTLDFPRLEQMVEAMPPSNERDYFAGIVANSTGRITESINLLNSALPQLQRPPSRRAAIALLTLADDYTKSYRYNDAIAVYEQLDNGPAMQLDEADRQDAHRDYQATLLLKDAPPQTVSFAGPVDVPMHRNPTTGSFDVTLTVNGVTESWVLDTGANFTVVSSSFAQRLGVTLSHEAAQVRGGSGVQNPFHVAILPELRLGAATLHNVVLLVLDDSAMNLQTGGDSHFPSHAYLGYPVLSALQRVTFTSDGHFLAGPRSPPATSGARMFMHQFYPLLECTVEQRPILFELDTGGNASFFSDRFHREFPSQFARISKRPNSVSGVGGTMQVDAYSLPHAQLGVGSTVVELKNVPVLPAMPRMGDTANTTYGILGRDLPRSYRSFTIDFAAMRFALGEVVEKRG